MQEPGGFFLMGHSGGSFLGVIVGGHFWGNFGGNFGGLGVVLPRSCPEI